MIGRLRKRLAHVLDRRFFALHGRVEHLAARVEDLALAATEREERLRSLVELRAGEQTRLLEAISSELHEELAPTLRIMAGNDAETRRLLAAARLDPEYELAFVEPEPLVTVIVSTFSRPELLTSRALPSILAQTHERLEVLVIGDAADAETELAVREVDDPRITFVNLTQRYLYPDPRRHWHAAATLTRNEGYRLARGRWLVDVDDDDAIPFDAIEYLLDAARERRLEVVQGVMRKHDGDGRTCENITPAHQPSLTGAVVHAHLRFYEREHVAAALGVGGDIFRGERMVRTGVRMGLVDRVTYEYYPSRIWESPVETP